MQLHDVIGIVEELRHEGKLVGNGFRIAAAHARDAGAVLRVTSNRRVNVKKSNRPVDAKVRAERLVLDDPKFQFDGLGQCVCCSHTDGRHLQSCPEAPWN